MKNPQKLTLCRLCVGHHQVGQHAAEIKGGERNDERGPTNKARKIFYGIVVLDA
jgi:hypothetical protein